MAIDSPAIVKVLVVDDESPGRRLISLLVAGDDEVEIVGEAASASQARDKIADLKPDLVFMDIEMPDGSGLDLLRSLPEPLPYVIFVTAHSEFALPAFELQAFDYLVKPVNSERFLSSLMRAKHRIFERRFAGLASQLANSAGAIRAKETTNGARNGTAPGPTFARQLTVRVRRKLISLKVDEIAWIEGASQYSRIHTHGGEFLLSRTLSSLESELDPSRFFRIHRSAIVNAAHVREVRSNGDGRYNVQLSDGLSLPIGRARKDIIQALLAELPTGS